MLVMAVEARSIAVTAVDTKAAPPIVCRLDGKLTDVRDAQRKKVWCSMLVTAVEARSIEVRADM